MQLTAREFRIALNTASKDQFVSRRSGQNIAIPRGNGAIFPCAIFLGDPAQEANLITDLSNITSVSYVIRKTNAAGDLLLQDTIDAEDFTNAALTFSQWGANTSAHFTIELSGEDTNQAMPEGKTSLDIYIAIQAETDGDPVLLGTGTGTIFEEGIGAAGAPAGGNPLYYTAAQADARYLMKGFVTATIDDEAESIDVDISALALTATPTNLLASIQPPADDSDALLIKHVRAIDSDTVRVRFAAAAPAAGYKVTVLAN